MGLAWLVVLFTEENTVETIPAKWTTENNAYAYWPNTKGRNLKEKIQLCAEPDENNWEKYPIRALGRGKLYDSYFEAKNAARKAENTSDINNSDDDETRKRRPKRNPIYASSEDEDDIPLELPIREKLGKSQGVTKLGGVSYTNFPNQSVRIKNITNNTECALNINTSDAEQKSKQCSNYAKVPPKEKLDYPKEHAKQDGIIASKNLAFAWPNTKELTSVSTCSKDCPNNYMLKKIMDQNIILNQKVNDISADITQILSILVNTQSTKCPTKENTDFNLPVNNNEDLQTLEEQLKNAEEFNEMVQYVTRIGGFNPYQSVKRALTRIMGNKLQIEFSWLGAKGKKAFANLNLAKIVIKGVLQNPACAKFSEEDIEKAIKGYLKHAVDREVVLKKKNAK